MNQAFGNSQLNNQPMNHQLSLIQQGKAELLTRKSIGTSVKDWIWDRQGLQNVLAVEIMEQYQHWKVTNDSVDGRWVDIICDI